MIRYSFVALTMLIIGCSDSDDTFPNDILELTGTWLLVEQYADPGDGSGDFVEVDSKKTIVFLQDATYRSNGQLCTMDSNTNANTFGSYVIKDTLTEFSNNNYLLPEGCDAEQRRIGIVLDAGSLMLTFPCIEGCAQKYIRI